MRHVLCIHLMKVLDRVQVEFDNYLCTVYMIQKTRTPMRTEQQEAQLLLGERATRKHAKDS